MSVPFRDCATARAVVVLLTVVLLLPAVPLTTSQVPQFIEIEVPQGNATVRQGSGPATWFIDGNGTNPVVRVQVENTGTGVAENIPVYVWALEDPKITNCGRVTVQPRNGLVPGSNTVDINLPLPPWKDEPGDRSLRQNWTFQILVNRNVTQPESPRSDVPATASCGGKKGGATDDRNAADNVAFFGLVKDRRPDFLIENVRWCEGSPRSECDEDFKLTSGDYHNTTRRWNESSPETNATYFAIDVNNTLEGPDEETPGNATWFDLVNVGDASCRLSNQAATPVEDAEWAPVRLAGQCREYAHVVEVRLAPEGQNVDTAPRFDLVTVYGDEPAWTTATFFMLNNSTTWTVRAKIEPNGPTHGLRETLATNNDFTNQTEIRSADLYGVFDLEDFATDPANPDPYPEGGSVFIEGDVVFHNDGHARPLNWSTASGLPTPPQRTGVVWNITLDNKTVLKQGVKNDVEDNETMLTQPWVESFSKTFFTSGDTDFITPGQHSLCVNIDTAVDLTDFRQTATATNNNFVLESNESNNKACIAIYLRDTDFPEFQTLPNVGAAPLVNLATFNDPPAPANAIKPKLPFSVHARVSDDAQSTLDVALNFTLASNTSVVRHYRMCAPGVTLANAVNCVYLDPNSDPLDRYYANITDFVFATNDTTTEVWNVRTEANDSAGHFVRSSSSQLTLNRWPIQTKEDTKVVLGLIKGTGSGVGGNEYHPDGVVLNWSDPGKLEFYLFVDKAWTGFTSSPNDQYNMTTTDTSKCAATEKCPPNMLLKLYLPGNPTTAIALPGNITSMINTCENAPDVNKPLDESIACRNVGEFKTRDVSSYRSRTGDGTPGRWNVTIEITDKGGDVRRINRSFILQDKLPELRAPTFSAASLNATQNLTVSVNVTDDFRVNHTYANFTRKSDGASVSILLSEPFATLVTWPDGSQNWTANITTGHQPGTILGLAGDYDAWFAAVDDFGSWNTTAKRAFKINDSANPRLLQAAPDETAAEVNATVRFDARATDESNMTGHVEILLGSAIVQRVNMTEQPPGSGNFTADVKCPAQGNYIWQVWVEDSKSQPSNQVRGTLACRDNLGPRFDVQKPGVKIDSKLYAKALPQISILLQDRDGVDASTINLSVGGANVPSADFVKVQTDSDGKAWIVNYTVEDKLNHRDVVQVNVSAFDLSAARLLGQTTFNFTVDDSPPVATMQPFAPRFRADDRNVWNVSLQTLFTITSSDNDGLPHGTPTIRYKIIGSANNEAQSVFSGPFSIKDAPAGIYTGPRPYLVTYWSEDDVGNSGAPGSLTIYVDDVPPSLDPFGILPQGRFVNATFTDERSGVDRAVVWASFNGQPFQPTALDFVNGIWSTVLPEGKKGDKVAYYLQAWDRVNNTETFGNSTEPYSTYTVGNHVPKLRITSPATGSTINGVVDLAWDASDEDGDPLAFTVYYRQAGKASFAEIAKVDAPGATKYALDTSRFTDGEYTFRVSASDGTFVSASEITVDVVNRKGAIGDVSPVPDEVQPGETVLITAQITKANAAVEARLFRDGSLVQAYPMNDEGRDGDAVASDGKYSVRVALVDAGDYTMQIAARYQENGELREQTLDGPAFAVLLTPETVIATYGGLIALVALLAIGGVAIAAFVLMRRR